MNSKHHQVGRLEKFIVLLAGILLVWAVAYQFRLPPSENVSTGGQEPNAAEQRQETVDTESSATPEAESTETTPGPSEVIPF